MTRDTNETELIGREKYWKEVNHSEEREDHIIDISVMESEVKVPTIEQSNWIPGQPTSIIEQSKTISNQSELTSNQSKSIIEQPKSIIEQSKAISNQSRLEWDQSKQARPIPDQSKLQSSQQEHGKKRCQTKRRSNTPNILQFFSKRTIPYHICYEHILINKYSILNSIMHPCSA